MAVSLSPSGLAFDVLKVTARFIARLCDLAR